MKEENQENPRKGIASLLLLVLGVSAFATIVFFASEQLGGRRSDNKPSESIAIRRGLDYYIRIKKSDSPGLAQKRLSSYLKEQLNMTDWLGGDRIVFKNR